MQDPGSLLAFLVSATPAGLALGLVYISWKRNREWRRTIAAWRAFARRCGLILTHRGVGSAELAGELAQRQVSVKALIDPHAGTPITRFSLELQHTTISIGSTERCPAERTLGDPFLEQSHAFAGPRAELLALFDAEGRELIKKKLGASTYLLHGMLVHEISGHVTDALEGVFATMRELGEKLIVPADEIYRRLLAHAKTEHHLGVRREVYRELFAAPTPLEIAEDAARFAATDADPFIRILGGLKTADFDKVELIAREEELSHDHRMYAYDQLAKRSPVPWAMGFVGRVMALDGTVAQREVLQAITFAQRKELLGALLQAARTVEMREASWVELAGAIGELADETAEPVLLDMLHRGLVIRRIAVRTLARVGSVRAVEPLLAIARDHPEVKPVIKEIQGRLLGAEAGRISIADAGDQAGAVSFPPVNGGELSLGTEQLRGEEEVGGRG